MWLNNSCCICRNCKLTDKECKDRRWFKDLERLVAHTPSFVSLKHDQEAIVCLAKCPRQTKLIPIENKSNETIVITSSENDTNKETNSSEICTHCEKPISLRNPSGYCDHLHYPEYCQICRVIRDEEFKLKENIQETKNVTSQ